MKTSRKTATSNMPNQMAQLNETHHHGTIVIQVYGRPDYEALGGVAGL